MMPPMDFSPKTVRVPTLGPSGMDFDVLADDTIIGPSIANGAWEDHETRLFLAHLRPGAKVLDLGANVGWFAVQAILAGAEVHAFEPVPGIADLTERNMKRAMEIGPGKGILHRAAAADAKGTAEIVLSEGNHGDNRVIDEAAPADMADAQRIEIKLERVDDLVQGPIDFLKVDTQGSEWLALQGATELLKASPKLGLLIEFWPLRPARLRTGRPARPADGYGLHPGQGNHRTLSHDQAAHPRANSGAGTRSRAASTCMERVAYRSMWTA